MVKLRILANLADTGTVVRHGLPMHKLGYFDIFGAIARRACWVTEVDPCVDRVNGK